MDQLNQQAQEFSNTGKPREALELMAKRMSLAEQADGKESVVYALALNDFADSASAAGIVDVGEKAHRDAIAIIEATEGPDGFDLATPLNNLATLLYFGSKNRTSEVEMLWQRSLAISEKYEGPLHLESLVTRANVGYAHKLLKHWDQAERSFREAIAIAAWHGDVSEASSAWFGMFELRRDQGRLDEAEPFVLRSYDLRVQSLGLRHPKTRMTMNNVVWLKRQLGRPQEAVPYLEQLADAESEIYGPEAMNTFMRRWELAGLYGEIGDWEKADALGKELESQTAVVYSHPLGDGFDPRVPR
jgi:tetratricopeptide (TPR) repeat protein